MKNIINLKTSLLTVFLISSVFLPAQEIGFYHRVNEPAEKSNNELELFIKRNAENHLVLEKGLIKRFKQNQSSESELLNIVRKSVEALLASSWNIEETGKLIEVLTKSIIKSVTNPKINADKILENFSFDLVFNAYKWSNSNKISFDSTIYETTSALGRGLIQAAHDSNELSDLNIYSTYLGQGTATAGFILSRRLNQDEPILSGKIIGGLTSGYLSKGKLLGIKTDSLISSSLRFISSELIKKSGGTGNNAAIMSEIVSIGAAESLINEAVQSHFTDDEMSELCLLISTSLSEGTTQAAIDLTKLNTLGSIMLVDIIGDVKVKHNQSGKKLYKHELRDGVSLPQGYTYETGKKSSTTLLLSNGSSLRLLENSKVEIQNYTHVDADYSGMRNLSELSTETGTSNTKVNVHAGDIIFYIRNLKNESSFKLQTSTGHAYMKNAKGMIKQRTNANGEQSTFLGNANGEQSTFLGLTIGDVVYKSNQSEIRIKPGQVALSSIDKAGKPIGDLATNRLPSDMSETIINETLSIYRKSRTIPVTQIILGKRETVSKAASFHTGEIAEVSKMAARGTILGALQAASKNQKSMTDAKVIAKIIAKGSQQGALTTAKTAGLVITAIAKATASGSLSGTLAAIRSVPFGKASKLKELKFDNILNKGSEASAGKNNGIKTQGNLDVKLAGSIRDSLRIASSIKIPGKRKVTHVKNMNVAKKEFHIDQQIIKDLSKALASFKFNTTKGKKAASAAIELALSKALTQSTEIDAIAFFTKKFMQVSTGIASMAEADILEVTKLTSIAINNKLSKLPATNNIDWIELAAKVADASISGSIRSALKVKVSVPRLARTIAYATALPYMQNNNFPSTCLIKIAKGINYGIPYKLIGNMPSTASDSKAPTLIQLLARNTSEGTVAAAIEANRNFEDVVKASMYAFSSSLITVAAKRKLGVKKIAQFAKFGARGIIAGGLDASAKNDLPLGKMGVIVLVKYDGILRLFRTSTGKSVPASEIKPGMTIHQDYTVMTALGAKATLLFSNGTMTTIDENSKLDIRKFSQEKFEGSPASVKTLKGEPSISNTELNLNYGSLVFNVKKLSKHSKLEITSPVGTTCIRGTTGKTAAIQDAAGNFSGGTSIADGSADFTNHAGLVTPVDPGKVVSSIATSSGQDIAQPQQGAMSPADTANVAVTVASDKSSSASTSLDSLNQSKIQTEKTAKVEVSLRAAERTKSVASSIGSAGVAAIKANGIVDPNNQISTANGEGTLLGVTIAAMANQMDVTTVINGTYAGILEGASSKSKELGKNPTIAINAINQGSDNAIDALGSLVTIVNSENINTLLDGKETEAISDIIDLLNSKAGAKMSSLQGADISDTSSLSSAQKKALASLTPKEKTALTSMSSAELNAFTTMNASEVESLANLSAAEVEVIRNLSSDEISGIKKITTEHLVTAKNAVANITTQSLLKAENSKGKITLSADSKTAVINRDPLAIDAQTIAAVKSEKISSLLKNSTPEEIKELVSLVSSGLGSNLDIIQSADLTKPETLSAAQRQVLSILTPKEKELLANLPQGDISSIATLSLNEIKAVSNLTSEHVKTITSFNNSEISRIQSMPTISIPNISIGIALSPSSSFGSTSSTPILLQRDPFPVNQTTQIIAQSGKINSLIQGKSPAEITQIIETIKSGDVSSLSPAISQVVGDLNAQEINALTTVETADINVFVSLNFEELSAVNDISQGTATFTTVTSSGKVVPVILREPLTVDAKMVTAVKSENIGNLIESKSPAEVELIVNIVKITGLDNLEKLQGLDPSNLTTDQQAILATLSPEQKTAIQSLSSDQITSISSLNSNEVNALSNLDSGEITAIATLSSDEKSSIESLPSVSITESGTPVAGSNAETFTISRPPLVVDENLLAASQSSTISNIISSSTPEQIASVASIINTLNETSNGTNDANVPNATTALQTLQGADLSDPQSLTPAQQNVVNQLSPDQIQVIMNISIDVIVDLPPNELNALSTLDTPGKVTAISSLDSGDLSDIHTSTETLADTQKQEAIANSSTAGTRPTALEIPISQGQAVTASTSTTTGDTNLTASTDASLPTAMVSSLSPTIRANLDTTQQNAAIVPEPTSLVNADGNSVQLADVNQAAAELLSAVTGGSMEGAIETANEIGINVTSIIQSTASGITQGAVSEAQKFPNAPLPNASLPSVGTTSTTILDIPFIIALSAQESTAAAITTTATIGGDITAATSAAASGATEGATAESSANGENTTVAIRAASSGVISGATEAASSPNVNVDSSTLVSVAETSAKEGAAEAISTIVTTESLDNVSSLTEALSAGKTAGTEAAGQVGVDVNAPMTTSTIATPTTTEDTEIFPASPFEALNAKLKAANIVEQIITNWMTTTETVITPSIIEPAPIIDESGPGTAPVVSPVY